MLNYNHLYYPHVAASESALSATADRDPGPDWQDIGLVQHRSRSTFVPRSMVRDAIEERIATAQAHVATN
jgi:hypothetical protein